MFVYLNFLNYNEYFFLYTNKSYNTPLYQNHSKGKKQILN